MKYDGCSGGLSKIWRKLFGLPPPWEHCCDIHDHSYASGGSYDDRAIADRKLMHCVLENGHPHFAYLMYVMVRVFGGPWWPFKWRWGFKLPYMKGYEKERV